MRIVLFSDIHANLPAFESALKSIDQLKPDMVYCLGDLVGYNVWPNDVINEIRKRRIPTIAGNHDAKARMLTESNLQTSGKNYAYSIIGENEKKYLSTLPSHLKIEFQLNDDLLTMLLVHGSPYSNDEYLLEEKDEADFLQIFQDTQADILCFGHSHKPYHRVLKETVDGVTYYRHAINTGSIGKPKDGNPDGCYVVIHIDFDSSFSEKNNLRVEFIRFQYDIDCASQAIKESPLPNEFAELLYKAV